MPRISRIHWCDVPADEPWQQFALWPEPVDHDACFATAGFTAFADSDETWDAEFETLVSAMVAALQTHGPARLVSGDPPRGSNSILLALVCAATDDQFQPCVLSFGDLEQAQLEASHGHPVLWVRLVPSLAFGPLLDAVAGERPTQRTELDWSVLSPAA